MTGPTFSAAEHKAIQDELKKIQRICFNGGDMIDFEVAVLVLPTLVFIGVALKHGENLEFTRERALMLLAETSSDLPSPSMMVAVPGQPVDSLLLYLIRREPLCRMIAEAAVKVVAVSDSIDSAPVSSIITK